MTFLLVVEDTEECYNIVTTIEDNIRKLRDHEIQMCIAHLHEPMSRGCKECIAENRITRGPALIQFMDNAPDRIFDDGAEILPVIDSVLRAVERQRQRELAETTEPGYGQDDPDDPNVAMESFRNYAFNEIITKADGSKATFQKQDYSDERRDMKNPFDKDDDTDDSDNFEKRFEASKRKVSQTRMMMDAAKISLNENRRRHTSPMEQYDREAEKTDRSRISGGGRGGRGGSGGDDYHHHQSDRGRSRDHGGDNEGSDPDYGAEDHRYSASTPYNDDEDIDTLTDQWKSSINGGGE